MLNETEFAALLTTFADDLHRNFSSLTAAQPEDQLKRPVQNLLEGLWQGDVVTRTEAQVAEVQGRPDIGVDVRSLLTGFVELKAPGLGANPARLRDPHSREQWKRFSLLPNLVYTDGNDWTLFRNGEQMAKVRASGDITREGSKAVDVTFTRQLYTLLRAFLDWEPYVPADPRALADLIAPLTRIVRDDVLGALQEPSSGLSHIAQDWRAVLFPNADDAQFADAYAQTLTYALLLARFHGAEELSPADAASALDSGHGLLADTLRVLADPGVHDEVGMGLDLLERTVAAIQPDSLQGEGNDPWLYFYEHFLAAYDPRLRNDYGVYYTPPAVIGAQVRLASELLERRLSKPLGFASEGVVVLDPAAGTGAYPLAVIQNALDQATAAYGQGIRTQLASQLASNIHAFEILVGPYAVAHLRVSQKVLEEGGSLPEDGASVYLTDTLESPYRRDMEHHGYVYRRLAHEHERAREVKRSTPVLVCIGNPPYDRQHLSEDDIERGVERHGGWVRFGDPTEGDEQTTGILSDFLEPAIQAGRGADLKNLYNLYVYFWRWALWKVFENASGPGVISFITAASYLRGPGFVGMREHMRRIFDELWIIDLEGDNLGARRTENVFAIQTPVAIAMGVRYGNADATSPANVWYTRIEGTREEKLATLSGIHSLDGLRWRECPDDWQAPFLPKGEGDYYSWPLLTDVFPWQHSGVQFKRTWPIGESRSVLEARWRRFLSETPDKREALFHETRDREVSRSYLDLRGNTRLSPLAELPVATPVPPIVRYAYRSLDRHWAIADSRLGDFLRPSLWRSHGPRQVYMTSLLTKVLGRGPAAMAAAHPPDLDHFSARGGKDVIPLWRDESATVPNIAVGLIDQLTRLLGVEVLPEDVFAYAYAVLSAPSYVDRFSEELLTPGPRLPITASPELFQQAADLGCRLIGFHTYGERMGAAAPTGTASNTVTVSATHDAYPTEYRYDALSCRLVVGEGVFEPVLPKIWNFEISGFKPVSSWLGYRMRDRSGRSSSDLDSIRPQVWSSQMSIELLELLWCIEATINVAPDLDELLDQIVAGGTMPADSMPEVDAAQRREPRTVGEQDALF